MLGLLVVGDAVRAARPRRPVAEDRLAGLHVALDNLVELVIGRTRRPAVAGAAVRRHPYVPAADRDPARIVRLGLDLVERFARLPVAFISLLGNLPGDPQRVPGRLERVRLL